MRLIQVGIAGIGDTREQTLPNAGQRCDARDPEEQGKPFTRHVGANLPSCLSQYERLVDERKSFTANGVVQPVMTLRTPILHLGSEPRVSGLCPIAILLASMLRRHFSFSCGRAYER